MKRPRSGHLNVVISLEDMNTRGLDVSVEVVAWCEVADWRHCYISRCRSSLRLCGTR
jgi:hypothetical protein